MRSPPLHKSAIALLLGTSLCIIKLLGKLRVDILVQEFAYLLIWQLLTMLFLLVRLHEVLLQVAKIRLSALPAFPMPHPSSLK
ncbi:hypothetical protein A6770_01845 [Nostoc minutum NIES-26]|uniref:Uncharacterized protein n=1 Tax=Nostoc minutum NIES-26 TaxID=1844469 RepID=A0A367QTB1_9NOSO|nr:hypothetical protein A6770_01845 [Nostoc minutum NIES-26]